MKKNGRFVSSSIFLVTLFILFITLQPSLKGVLFPKNSKDRLQQLIDATISKKTIDSQLFWETREFTAPGVFHFEREGLSEKLVKEAMKKQRINVLTQSLYPFLTFSSSKWESIEFLTEQTVLSNVVSDYPSLCTKIQFQKSSELICTLDNGSTLIAFIKPISQMKKANAFFDFAGRDGVIVEGKYWLSVSTIQID